MNALFSGVPGVPAGSSVFGSLAGAGAMGGSGIGAEGAESRPSDTVELAGADVEVAGAAWPEIHFSMSQPVTSLTR
jgi:hypothetical protein